MQLTRNGIETAAGPAQWFTDGPRRRGRPAGRAARPRSRASRRARTHWHTHPNGQTIFVTEGICLARRAAARSRCSRPGDRAFFEPGEDHWHGAAPGRFMTHLAMLRSTARAAMPTGASPSPTPSTAPHRRSTAERRGRGPREATLLGAMAAEADDTVKAAAEAAEADDAARLRRRRRRIRWRSRVLSFNNLMAVSIIHSFLFTGLMLCAFVLGHPQPATFIFGFTHGVLYMAMAVLAGVAAKLRTISVTTALVVIILGAIGPYFGTYDFLREWSRKRRAATTADAPA